MRPPSDRRVGQAPVRFLDEKHQPHLQLTATTASLHRKFPPKSRNFAARQVWCANKDRRQLISNDLSVTLRPTSEFAAQSARESYECQGHKKHCKLNRV